MTALASLGGLGTLLALCWALWLRSKLTTAQSQRDDARRDLIISREEIRRLHSVVADKDKQIEELASEVVTTATDPALAAALAKLLSRHASEDN